MPTTTNFGWTTPADTDLVKDGALAIRTLANGIDTSFLDLKGGTTGQYLIKNSNTDLDFTWTTNTADIDGVTASSPLTGGGTSGTITVGIQDGTTTQKGAVQLEDSTSSTSTTKAATPNSVKSAYDLANGAIAKSLVDAAGDLIYGSADNTVARLAIGTTGQVLTVSGGLPAWATASSSPSFVGCRAYRATSNVSVNNNTWTAIAFNAESWDTNTFHDNTTNNSRITIPTGKGGYYFLSASVNAEAQGTTTTSYVDIWVNGSGGGISIPISIGWQNPTNGDSTRKTSGTIYLNAGDYFEVMYLQDSGSAKNYKADIAGTFVDIHYLGA